MKKERAWDNYLQIHTTGRDDARADQYHHPYEPTPYAVLERLADSGFFREGDTVVDYGCGKGRVGFFWAARRARRPSASNTTSASTKSPWRTAGPPSSGANPISS